MNFYHLSRDTQQRSRRHIQNLIEQNRLIGQMGTALFNGQACTVKLVRFETDRAVVTVERVIDGKKTETLCRFDEIHFD